jgi:hypothetical protein
MDTNEHPMKFGNRKRYDAWQSRVYHSRPVIACPYRGKTVPEADLEDTNG